MFVEAKIAGVALSFLSVMFVAAIPLADVFVAPRPSQGPQLVMVAGYQDPLPDSTVATTAWIKFPKSVVAGDTIDITVEIEQFEHKDAGGVQLGQTPPTMTLPPSSDRRDTLKWPLKITMSSGGVDWDGVVQTRPLPAGTDVRTKRTLLWSPLTKERGDRHIRIIMTMENEYDPLTASLRSKALVTVNGSLVSEGERDDIPIDIEVMPNPWLTHDQYVLLCWTGGGLSFFGAGMLLGGWKWLLIAFGILRAARKKKEPKKPEPEPVRRTPQERRADRSRS